MPTLATRLTSAGVLQAAGYFDEVTTTTNRVTPTGIVYSGLFDEVTNQGGAASRQTNNSLSVGGSFDEKTLQPPSLIQYLVVAGGGGGGNYGGGGAGGVLTASNVFIQRGSTYSATVGQGGVSTFNGVSALNIDGNGGNSSLVGSSLSVIAIGGGAGATSYTGNGGGAYHSGYNGANGGSGGGGGGNRSSGDGGELGGTGVAGQGNNGGSSPGASCTPSGGGGGAGAPGGNGTSTNGATTQQRGGIGIANPITGSTVGQLSGASYWIAGGGAGCSNNCAATSLPISGGIGGGGNSQGSGVYLGSYPTAGFSNTGGGGGGGFTLASGAGGSGVVVLSIPTISYSGVTTGNPVVTTSGQNTLITFLTNGSYTA